MVHSQPPICWESYRDRDRLQISSSEASKVASVYCHLDSKVASTSADSPDGVYFRQKFETLQKKLRKLKALDISWIGLLPGQSRFSVAYFSNLEYLRIEGCPPSSIFGSFNAHLHRLKEFSITDCVGLNLSRLLLPWRSDVMSTPLIDGTDDSTPSECKADVDRSYCWQSLSTLRLSNCGLSVMDNSLHYLPVVTDVDFSDNDIPEILHLQDCYQLETLNLSRNTIRALPNISDALGNISMLNISYNHVESLDGIEKLSALRTLDISYNHIIDFKEIVYLTKLTSLENLHLLGNPISLPEARNGRAPGVAAKTLALMVYRKLVLKHLLIDDLLFDTGRTLPIVDYKLICKAELQTFRYVIDDSSIYLQFKSSLFHLSNRNHFHSPSSIYYILTIVSNYHTSCDDYFYLFIAFCINVS